MHYSATELVAMQKQSKTDWAKVKTMPQKEADKNAEIAEGVLPEGWEKTVIVGLPPRKDAIKLRIDNDVLSWFKKSGKGYQTRINNVLKAFVALQLHENNG